MKSIQIVAAGAALLAASAGASRAWTTTVGTESAPTCVKTVQSNGQTLFTLDTDLFTTTSGSNTLYTYRLDLTNNTDASALTKLSVSASNALDYFIGFGPGANGVAYHDSNIGVSTSPTVVSTGQNTTNPLTKWSADAGTTSGVTTVTFYANTSNSGITAGKDLQGEGMSGSTVQSEYLFVQSLTDLGSLNVDVYDAGQSAPYALTTCNLQPNGTQPVPEPGALLPFVLGGLGVLGLTIRARRRVAA